MARVAAAQTVRSALLVAAAPGEIRAVLTESGRPVDFWIERLGEGSRIGEIHVGRVTRILPALPAALVEIGAERPAFLSAEDATDLAPAAKRAAGISAWLTEGQSLLVQVTRDAQGDKAIGLTARIKFPGRLLSLTPTRDKFVFPRAADEATRTRLLDDLAAALPRGHGAILTDAALEAAPDALRAELAQLGESWRAVLQRAAGAAPPALLSAPEEPVERLLAQVLAPNLGPPPEIIRVDDRGAHLVARRWLARQHPELLPALAFETGDEEIFERHGVASAIEDLAQPRIALPGGGALTIETVEAMSVIDVDGGAAMGGRGDGRRAALAANQAAAMEAARQIRLRNLAGAIVIDFISMKRREDRAAVLETLSEAMQGDPAAPQILGWTRLGHVELTRKRSRRPLAEILFEEPTGAAPVKSPLTIALEALRAASREARRPGAAPMIRTHPEIAAALAGPAAAAHRQLEARLARPVAICSDPLAPPRGFAIEPGRPHLSAS